MKFTEAIMRMFRRSTRFHLDHRRVSNLFDMVQLIDRFLDDKLYYDLEWDDFVSWKNQNVSIEAYRQEIANLEIGLFSEDKSQRRKATHKLIEIRNKASALGHGEFR